MDESVNTQPPAPADSAIEGGGEAAPVFDAEAMKESVIAAVSMVYDPEIPINIYALGLIYSVEATAPGNVEIIMTLTSPMCPVAEALPQEVEMKAAEVAGVENVTVMLTWDPPWNPDMMGEAARLDLGFM